MRMVLSGYSASAGEASDTIVARMNPINRRMCISCSLFSAHARESGHPVLGQRTGSPLSRGRAKMCSYVPRPFDRRVLREKVLVHLDPDAGLFQRPHVA